MEFSGNNAGAGASNHFSELDQPLTEEQLAAVDIIEATFLSARAKRNRSNSDESKLSYSCPETRRRLPDSILSLKFPHSSPLSTCKVNSKMRFPAMNFDGRIIYSRTVSEVERASRALVKKIQAMRKEMDQVFMGLDIEWKPTFRKGVPPGKTAVMQLCIDNSQCHVMHIIHSGIPQTLQTLLEDATLSKVGVGIANDARKVLKDYNVSIKAVEDISYLANQKLAGAPQNWSLKSLTETLVSKELQKPNKIRLGNWEVAVLSKAQLQYAAIDAFTSWYLHKILQGFPDVQKVEDTERNEEENPIAVTPQ